MTALLRLKQYQLDAVNDLHTGAVLKGGVGTGKTITALAYYYHIVCGGYSHLIGPYGSENYRLPIFEKPLVVITTPKKRDSKDWQREATNFLIDGITVDSWNNIEKYVDKKAFFIFDEQRVVGKGKWAKTFIKIAKVNDWILLSATPGDGWMDYVPLFLANGFYKNRSEFIQEHVIYAPFLRFPKIIGYKNVEKLVRLKNSITVEMTSEKINERNYRVVDTNYDKEGYKKLLKNRKNPLTGNPIETAAELVFLQRRLVNTDQSKFDALTLVVGNRKKVILFYNYNYELFSLREHLDSIGVPYSEWNGFRHEPIPDTDQWVYLCQYTSASEGWNAIETNTVVFFSLNYSYKIMEQSAGRIDRMNTPFGRLYYYIFLSSAPIDKAVKIAVDRKELFNEMAYFNAL